MKCLMLAALLFGCAASRPAPGTPVVDLGDLGEAGAPTEPTILRIPAGTRLPVAVTIETPLASAEGADPAFHLVFARTVYWYPSRPDLVSFDGKRWKKLTRLYRGSLDLGVSRTARDGPKAFVKVAMRPR